MSLKKVLIIQARMSSTRLPGKTMMPLFGKPLIYRMVERLKKCQKIDKIVIATSTKDEDLVIKATNFICRTPQKLFEQC